MATDSVCADFPSAKLWRSSPSDIRMIRARNEQVSARVGILEPLLTRQVAT